MGQGLSFSFLLHFPLSSHSLILFSSSATSSQARIKMSLICMLLLVCLFAKRILFCAHVFFLTYPNDIVIRAIQVAPWTPWPLFLTPLCVCCAFQPAPLSGMDFRLLPTPPLLLLQTNILVYAFTDLIGTYLSYIHGSGNSESQSLVRSTLGRCVRALFSLSSLQKYVMVLRASLDVMQIY